MRFDPEVIADESSLWSHFKSGDKAAFASIYERYAGTLYNYGFHISGDGQIVEDAIQDLFVVLWQSRERLSPTTSIKYYLFRCLRRQIVKLSGKAESPIPAWEEALWPNEPSAEMQIIAQESETRQWKELEAALRELTPRQLEAIRLHYYEGFDLATIASIMEMNEQSVRNILHRSLYRLRHVMHLLVLCWGMRGEM